MDAVKSVTQLEIIFWVQTGRNFCVYFTKEPLPELEQNALDEKIRAKLENDFGEAVKLNGGGGIEF